MDIAALSTSLAQGKIMSQVSVSLAKMGMNLAKQQGQALQQLVETSSMEQSITPHVGGNIDIKL
ncbi:YjfB family protein [Vallitalea pronyensis]|uniref:YjfB family protein n=1 Tax=Vallitalea pronyensis TaxID=1348613 RepID=A0A8J8SFB4_9FIRM|nr:YjfB family protein [Vallitalea pronyensis]QUI21460.1 YjfB family protein [Vallitalea pronyensis]